MCYPKSEQIWHQCAIELAEQIKAAYLVNQSQPGLEQALIFFDKKVKSPEMEFYATIDDNEICFEYIKDFYRQKKMLGLIRELAEKHFQQLAREKFVKLLQVKCEDC